MNYSIEIEFLYKRLSCLYDEMNPTLGEFLKSRLKPEYELGKFAIAVEKCDVVVGH